MQLQKLVSSQANVLNKSSSLAEDLGMTKFMTSNVINVVILKSDFDIRQTEAGLLSI